MAKNSVLIIDDEAISVSALSEMLSDDYIVYAETNGTGGIEVARNLLPDMILLDVVMPGISGFEVISTLKKEEKTKDIPVIFITSMGDSHDEEMGLALGAADYISKPFSKSIVKLRVQNQSQIINQIRTINTLSMTDTLTGIGNRRFFNNVVSSEWKRAKRMQTNISFMILDIDNFKNYNDSYGHLQGDVVIKELAAIMKSELERASDKIARWGGEEFAIVLPETSLSGAIKVAEDIRKRVENANLALPDGTITPVTVSIGVHSIVPSQIDVSCTLDKFLSDADNALYHAKRTGKNKVCTIKG